MSDDQISDEDLTAFLDQALEEDQAALIRAALARDPALSERLAALDFPMDQLQNEASVLAQHIPPVSPPVAKPLGPKVWWIAASLAAGIVIGAGAMRLANAPDTWVDVVASYQALYVPATLSGAVQAAEVTAAVISSFEAEAGLSLAGVTEVDGLTFKRAQTLGIDGRTLLQLAYVTSDGTPVAFCLTPVSEKDQVAQASITYGLQAVNWIHNGTGFVLIGDLPSDRLLKFYGQLSGA